MLEQDKKYLVVVAYKGRGSNFKRVWQVISRKDGNVLVEKEELKDALETRDRYEHATDSV